MQPEKQAENAGRKPKPDGRSQDALKHAKSCKLRSFEHPPPPPTSASSAFYRSRRLCLSLSLSLPLTITFSLFFLDPRPRPAVSVFLLPLCSAPTAPLSSSQSRCERQRQKCFDDCVPRRLFFYFCRGVEYQAGRGRCPRDTKGDETSPAIFTSLPSGKRKKSGKSLLRHSTLFHS